MKVIIAGGRDITDTAQVVMLIEQCVFEHNMIIDEVVCGTQRGVDSIGEVWAEYHGIPVKKFKPDWDRLGRSAGPSRNAAMADYGDVAIVIWDGSSPGSRNMINQMKQRGKMYYEYIYDHG